MKTNQPHIKYTEIFKTILKIFIIGFLSFSLIFNFNSKGLASTNAASKIVNQISQQDSLKSSDKANTNNNKNPKSNPIKKNSGDKKYFNISIDVNY
jgi:hypothetical protein